MSTPASQIKVKNTGRDFSELHERMRWYVDNRYIPHLASVILKGDEVIDLHFCGGADLAGSRAGSRPLNETSIFRMHSSTKIICSLAAMMLWEEGKFALDDPVEKYIPALGDMQVLKPDASSIEDTEPAKDSIRINQILSHTAGFSYGFIELESIIDRAYNKAQVNPFLPGTGMTLESLCESLGQLPLAFQPGSFWRYSFATDITARLIEVISGQDFDAFLKERIFKPLNMADTDFYVPESKLGRLATMYPAEDQLDPMSKLLETGEGPENTSQTKRPAFLSGGGGLLSTLADYLSLTRLIINEGTLNGQTLVKPETLLQMRSDQCPQGVGVNFPMWSMPNTGFGLGFALKHAPAKGEPDSARGEFHWGGMAGTHFWWSPNANLTGICMTQRMPGFWHPFSHDFKRLAYKIAAD